MINIVKIRRLLCDNRGSAIISVLVTMAFVIILAAILLYMSLVNMQMKKLDREGKAVYYDAEAAANEIRTGIQGAVSEAISDAYTEVLVNYNSTDETQRKTTFQTAYLNSLKETLALPDDSFSLYDPEAFLSYVTEKTRVTLTGTVMTTQSADGWVTSVTFKDLTVTYSSVNGYVSSVTTDIRIEMPPTAFQPSQLALASLPNFAVIAETALQQTTSSGALSLTGSVYAGALNTSNNGNTLSIRNASNFVCAGTVTIQNSAAVNFNVNSSLWARDIDLDTGGIIRTYGNAYIANDLNLHGDGTEAILSGRYYGYGSSSSNPDESSAIVINGKHTLLDMSALSVLTLAGHSFVDYTSDNVLMGQSISVKSDQLVYLVPAACLTAGITNPYQIQTDPGNATLQSYVSVTQPIFPNGNSLSTYGVAATDIQCIRKLIGQGGNTVTLVYFCIRFPSVERANAYFKDYYAANSTALGKYTAVYTNGITLMDNAIKNISGEAYTFNAGLAQVLNRTAFSSTPISELPGSFENLCVTLSKSVPGGGEASPFEYYLDETQMAAVSGTTTYSKDGDVRVIVTNASNYNVSQAPGTVNLILSTGNVTVDRDFSGLIIARGTVELQANVTANSAAVSSALQALRSSKDGTGYYLYLNQENIKLPNNDDDTPTPDTGSGDESAALWDLNNLVVFYNWRKNAE
ncbi:hypothetical protein IZU99_08135 [Oscillospiraceae bacterium CM]|nr:hypothetical protein IZU99_08135 [Oscillospiraceae bacterium CM]